LSLISGAEEQRPVPADELDKSAAEREHEESEIDEASHADRTADVAPIFP
jgi:hypothetical protein